MERYAIGLDLGTSSAKAVLFSEKLGIIAKSTAPFSYRRAYLPSGAEYLGIDPEEFYRTVTGTIKELSAHLPAGADLSGIAMASASGNSLICDRQGNAKISAYSWLNKPFTEEIRAVFGEGFGSEVRESAGWGLSGSFPLGQLSHVRLNSPELLSEENVVCMTTEYLLKRLTGEWGIDVSTATPFFFLDQKKRCWNKEYLSALGLCEAQLPPLRESGDLLGSLTSRASADTGLPEGTKVFVGSFDHPTAARASGILKEGDLLVSCGTSWVCLFPMEDRESIVKNEFLCDPFLTPRGPWAAMCSLARASERIAEIVEKYIASGENKFAELEKYAELSNGKTDGLSFNPLAKELPDLSAYSKESIARALMEGIAGKLKERISGTVKIDRIAMCGGPSSSKMWRQVISEVFGAEVTVTYGAHSGAVGAAMYALK
ncbi:MAG: hypothetical protein IJE25_05545 [Clostridia bacterium]|nr:hypothetical protein [Clostridia bacterium]